MAALIAEFLTAARKPGRHEVAEITFVDEESRRIRVWKPVAGSAFMNIDECNGLLHEHYTVILTEPDSNNRVVTVNLTTLHEDSHHDDSCIVEPGEVPLGKGVRSYAYYAMSRLRDADELAYGIARQILRPKPPAGGTLLWRLRKGFLASPYADRALADAVRRASAT